MGNGERKMRMSFCGPAATTKFPRGVRLMYFPRGAEAQQAFQEKNKKEYILFFKVIREKGPQDV